MLYLYSRLSTKAILNMVKNIKLLLALQQAVFWFIEVENESSKCVETFCCTISIIIGFHFSAKIVL